MPENPTPRRTAWQRMLSLAWPIVAVNVGNHMMAVVDTALSGRISGFDQAATGLGATVFFFGSLLGVGVVMGLDPLISQSLGAGNRNAAGRQLALGLWVALAVALPLVLATGLAGHGLEAIGIDAPLAAQSRVYLYSRLPSLVPLMVVAALRTWLQASYRVRPILGSTMIAGLFNVAASCALVFGDSGLQSIGLPAIGLPDSGLGIAGLGIASTAAALLQAILLGLVLAGTGVPGLRMDMPTVAEVRPVLAIGIPIGLHLAAEIGIFTLAGLVAGGIGTEAMAAHQVALQIAALTFMVPMGFGQAASVLIGNAIGARDRTEVLRAASVAMTLGTGFMAVSAVAMWTFAVPFASVMSGDSAVIQVAASLLTIAAAFQLFDGVQAVSAGILRGCGLTRWTMTANILGHWGVGCPLLLLWSSQSVWGVHGIWLGLTAGLAVTAALMLWRMIPALRRCDWIELSVS